jgi:hypothetical protein
MMLSIIVLIRPYEHEPSMESKKHTSLLFRAAPALLGKPNGPYVYWLVVWWNWDM